MRLKYKSLIVLLSPAIIIAAALLAYYNSFSCSWHLDDFHAIVDFNYDTENIVSLLLLRKQRALGFITFLLNYRLCGYNPAGWHIVNLFIHAINSLIVYAISFKLFIGNSSSKDEQEKYYFGYAVALIIALIFAVHPIQSSAVTYIVQRIELLGTLFVLSSFYFSLLYISTNKKQWKIFYLVIVILSLALGAVTKETIVIAPILIGAYIVIIRLKTWRTRLSTILLAGIVGIIIACAGLIMFKALTFTPAPHLTFAPFNVLWRDLGQSPVVYYSTQMKVILRFLRLCVLPYGQCVEYYMPASGSFLELSVIISFSTHIGIIILALILWRRFPLFLFGVFWFYLFLIPSSILPNGIFEHRLYGAIIGLLIAIFISAGHVILKLPLSFKRLASIVTLCFVLSLISSFIFMTIIRNKVWKTDYSLWKECVTISPENWRANQNFGYALMNMGEYNEARKYLEKSFSQKSNVWAVANNLGLLYTNMDMLDRGIEMFEYGLKLKPDSRLLQANLGACYLMKGEVISGTNLLVLARTPESIYTLGDFYLKCGNYTEALKCFNRVLKIIPEDPDAKAGKARAIYLQNK